MEFKRKLKELQKARNKANKEKKRSKFERKETIDTELKRTNIKYFM